jgi:hypothetical protein
MFKWLSKKKGEEVIISHPVQKLVVVNEDIRVVTEFLEGTKKELESKCGVNSSKLALRIDEILRGVRESCPHTNKNNSLGIYVCLDCRSVLE